MVNIELLKRFTKFISFLAAIQLHPPREGLLQKEVIN